RDASGVGGAPGSGGGARDAAPPPPPKFFYHDSPGCSVVGETLEAPGGALLAAGTIALVLARRRRRD
ncbi:MAG TPA: MYXO-CTERM sorting domain-containing protein, partial [Polyangia bacterium]|nr:MYXO-CTERM sorting domain-containing protein [Polyangia bacterium]